MRRTRFTRTAVIAVLGLFLSAACGASPDVERTVAARNAAAQQAGGTSAVAGPAVTTDETSSTDTTGSQASGPSGASSGSASDAASDAAPPPQAPSGGNGGATEKGVTATTIKIGGTFFNGGFLDKYSQVSEQAASAYFPYINDRGGVFGRKIEYITCDTAGQAQGTASCLNKFINSDKVFALGPSLDFNLDTVQPTIAKEGIPWVGTSGLYIEEFGSPLMFPTQLRGPDVGAHILTHAVRKLGAKTIGVSYVTIGAGPTCSARVEALAKKLGAQVVAKAVNEDVNNGLTSQVQTMASANPDVVLFCNDPVNTVKFIQAAGSRGYKPPKGFIGGFVAADDVPEAMGRAGVGVWGFSSYDFYKLNTPALKRYREITEFYFPRTFHHFYTQAAYTGAVAIVEAIKAAGPNLTRKSFIAALKGLKNFESMGLKFDFNNLGKNVSGIMLRADENLKWQPVGGRFTAAG